MLSIVCSITESSTAAIVTCWGVNQLVASKVSVSAPGAASGASVIWPSCPSETVTGAVGAWLSATVNPSVAPPSTTWVLRWSGMTTRAGASSSMTSTSTLGTRTPAAEL